MFFVCGCPVLTKNSIDEGSFDVPAWLPGKWCEVDKDGKLKEEGYLLEKTGKKGLIKCYDISAGGVADKAKQREVILSKVGSKVYMSVYTPADDMTEEGYYLFEFRKVSNTEFVLAGIKEKALDYLASPADIRDYLKDNMYNTLIFDQDGPYTYRKQ